MQKKINYLTKDIYNICQKLIKDNCNFSIEVTDKNNIKSLNKTLPYLIGVTKKKPSVLSMFLTAIKFGEIYAIIGSIHREKKYKMSYTINNTLLLHFYHIKTT
jgi:hypothetical protein